jgi:hypothetical protein
MGIIVPREQEKKMKRIISMSFLQRDTVRSMHPELWHKCQYLETGKFSKIQYSWRYATTTENALALRLMGLCAIEDQDE